MDNSVADIAAQFVNSTSSHIFLTGKAGTGKTTFLRNLKTRTHKNFIVVAPTGIAALNAGGVTVHSQFLLPMGTYIPERNIPSNLNGSENFYTSDILARKHPLNSIRKQVLRSIDLLVIDEVSMLRADLLDAIDYRMKAARGNFYQSFGGVQMLFIGDLYQLPPVVRRDEDSLMSRYYSTPWFFDAQGLQQDKFVYVELDKIFRQHDNTFIALLNNLRNNCSTEEDIQKLNTFYRSDEAIKEIKEVITLTTHNAKADELNQQSLAALPNEVFKFEARVNGDFPDSMFPVLQSLVLKEGAQIMFVKNDVDKMYFNGKLATVINLSSDSIEVEMAETHVHYKLKREVWENKKYTVDSEKQDLESEVVGTFEQYPIKLAWAITVHKSQGLTFDKAIIDVGQAFADGQVYVALSRLRTLEGLILRTHINPNVISTDKRIVSFTQNSNQPERLPELIKQGQIQFIRQLLLNTFDFTSLTKEIAYIKKSSATEFLDESMQPVLVQIEIALQEQKENTDKFKAQLQNLLAASDYPHLLERIGKGVDYFQSIIWEQEKLLLTHIQSVQQQKRVKTYLNHLNELDQLLFKKLEEMKKATFLTESILNQTNNYDFTDQLIALGELRQMQIKEVRQLGGGHVKAKAPRKKRQPKKKGDDRSTYDITLDLLKSGLDVEAIAKTRELAIGTIEGHLAKAVGASRINIQDFMSESSIGEISTAIETLPEGYSSKDLFEKLKGKFGYGQLRAVMLHVSLNR